MHLICASPPSEPKADFFNTIRTEPTFVQRTAMSSSYHNVSSNLATRFVPHLASPALARNGVKLKVGLLLHH